MEHDIPFGNSNRENGPTFLDFPLFLGVFQWDEPTKRVPFTAEPEIPEILTKWKAPKFEKIKKKDGGRSAENFFLAFKDVFCKFSSRWLPLTGLGQIQRKTKKNSFYHILWFKRLWWF